MNISWRVFQNEDGSLYWAVYRGVSLIATCITADELAHALDWYESR